eukprot:m.110501 g.110501  ORF g.110501 m.110501 type:complete len:77 (-) comp14041_c0_seq1:737-967(-)
MDCLNSKCELWCPPAGNTSGFPKYNDCSCHNTHAQKLPGSTSQYFEDKIVCLPLTTTVTTSSSKVICIYQFRIVVG